LFVFNHSEVMLLYGSQVNVMNNTKCMASD